MPNETANVTANSGPTSSRNTIITSTWSCSIQQPEKHRKVRADNPKRDPKKPCLYVGMTGLTPEERFANHKAGTKDAPLVKRFGIRLLPELYDHLNPMPFKAAAQMEQDLAEDLRRAGYTVTGGH